MKLPLFGRKNGATPKAQPFEPNEAEAAIIGEFGGANRVPFMEVRQQLTERGIGADRSGHVWERIRESRSASGRPQLKVKLAMVAVLNGARRLFFEFFLLVPTSLSG